jgi:type 1 glutamine amidotransferase
MARTSIPTFVACILFACTFCSGEKIKVSMYAASAEYKADQSLDKLKAYLESKFDIACTVNKGEDKGTQLPGVDQLETADVIIIYTRRVNLNADQVKLFQKYCKSGRGVIGIRTASHAFQTWLEFDRQILGGDYRNHYGIDRKAEVSISPKGADHPVLRAVRPFVTMGKLYKNPAIASDTTLLLSASTGEYTEPVAWTRIVDRTRVFYTSLGVPDDFKEPNFLRLLANAVFWTARREVPQEQVLALPNATRFKPGEADSGFALNPVLP